jgi:opacity protein-like surface antigen
MPRLRLLAAAVIAPLLTAAAGAQPLLSRGTQALSLHVSPDFEGAVGDMLVLDASYGWFLRDRVALEATLDYTTLEDVAGEDSDYRTSAVGLAAEVHLPLGGSLVPYAGFGIGWRRSHFGDAEESGLVYGPRAGLEYFLAENVALDLEIAYSMASADVFVNDFAAEDTDITSALGLRVHF